MSETARLCDITTEVGSDLASFNFLANERGLDGLEYHMGMSRGDIVKYSSITTTDLHRDMIELFKSSAWGILPPLDVLQKIYDLYEHNRKLSTATAARTLFTEILPQKEYEYELLPIRTPDKLPIYVGDVRHDHPYPNLPRVKTTIHPCFVIESVFHYILEGLDYAPNSVADDVQELISSIGIIRSLCVNLSWLHGTWDEFLDRPVPTARPDLRPKRKPELQLPFEDDSDSNVEGYTSDQPRDCNDPRIQIRRERIEAYMLKHDRRYQDEEEDESESESEGKRVNSTDVQPPIVRRSKRLQSDISEQSVVDSKKRTTSATSNSVSGPPPKRQRRSRGMTLKKHPARNLDAVDDSVISPPAPRRSLRTRKVVSR